MSHWGEIPTVTDEDSAGIVAVEREQITKPRPMEVEGPKLYPPSSRHYPPTSESFSSDHFDMDPYILHTIQLLQYAKKLKMMIMSAQHQQESVKAGEIESLPLPLPPPIPRCQNCKQKHSLQTPVPFLPKDTESKFLRGDGEPPREIDSPVCRQLARRSVAALCAHAGFDNCGDSVLETLTDITQDHLRRVTQLLRTAVDNEALTGVTGFQDPVQQVMNEIGLGSLSCLHDFYQSRVINYHNNMILACQQLTEDYEKLQNPEREETGENTEKTKEKDDTFPDIHFPASEVDSEDLDHSASLDGFSGHFEKPTDQSEDPVHEDEQKWTNQIKTEAAEIKPEPHEDFTTEDPSHIDDNEVKDPPSVTGLDIMSPPTSSGKGRPPKKKRKR